MTTLKKLVDKINSENAPIYSHNGRLIKGWSQEDKILRKIKDIQNDIHHSNWKVSDDEIITNKDKHAST